MLKRSRPIQKIRGYMQPRRDSKQNTSTNSDVFICTGIPDKLELQTRERLEVYNSDKRDDQDGFILGRNLEITIPDIDYWKQYCLSLSY